MTTVLITSVPSALPESQQEKVIIELKHDATLKQAVSNVAGIQAFVRSANKRSKASKKRAFEPSRVAYSVQEMMAMRPISSVPVIPEYLQAAQPGWASECMKNFA